jgi:CRP/FNR family transcriptional regulator
MRLVRGQGVTHHPAPLWSDALGAGIVPASRDSLATLPVLTLPPGRALFHQGQAAEGFVVVLSGRIDVYLTAHSGREILLYSVEPGQSCIQSTLGLLGGEVFSGTATCAGEVKAVLVPRGLFLSLMDSDPAFRRYILAAFGKRMRDLTLMLERVAFGRIEPRLAQALIDTSIGDRVSHTQEALAVRIGSAREVVTRHLRDFADQGLIRTARGRVDILDPARLSRIAAGDL